MPEVAVKKTIDITEHLKKNHHHLAAIMDRVEKAKAEQAKEG